MRGYDVITSDGEKLGHVVGTDGSMLLIERGTIRKSRFAVPQAIAETDRAENEVRLAVSRQVVELGPKIEDGVDEHEIAEYYGIVDGSKNPDTRGDGEVLPGDPTRGAEQDAQRFGLESSDEQRARARKGIRPETPPDEGRGAGVRGSAAFGDYGPTKE